MILKKQHNVLILVFLVIGFLTACEKSDDSVFSGTGFIKTHDSEIELIARGSFQLPNADIILFGCSYELSSQTATFGTHRSEISWFSPEGDLKRSQQVPREIHALWDGVVFDDGTMLFVGFDTLRGSPNLGLVHMSGQGEVLDSKVIVNAIGWTPDQTGDGANQLTANHLSDGTVLLCLGTYGIGGTFMRLIQIDRQLNVIVDQTFDGNPGNHPLRVHIGNAFVSETVEGTILVNSLTELSLPGFEVVNQFETQTTGNSFIKVGDRIFISSLSGNNGGYMSIRNMESFITNDKISMVTLHNDIETNRLLSDIPGNAYLAGFERTSDGGFIGIGCCNVQESVLVSKSKIVVSKFSHTGALEWTKIIDSGQMLIGQSITESSVGYLIAATSFSFDNDLQMALIQIDKNGNY